MEIEFSLLCLLHSLTPNAPKDPDLAIVQERIKAVMDVLQKFSKNKEGGK